MSSITPIIVPLSSPVTIGEGDRAKTYTELVFARTRRGKDMIASDAVAGETRKSFAVYASMAEVPLQVFNEMEYGDIQEVMTAVVPLLGKSKRPAMAPDEKDNPNLGET